MSFDAFQRECLAEMGYAVYRLASQPATAVAAQAPAQAATPDAGRLDAGGSDALVRALVRAIGADPADAGAVAACRALLPPAGLPDAQARRALWPRLRALRVQAVRR